MKKLAVSISIILLILAATLLPRIFSLDSYVTTDENLWAVRSANFYYALGQRDFTVKTTHPGVTTMWAGTAAFLWRFPEYRGIGIGYVNAGKYKNTLEDFGFGRTDLLASGRIFMVLANTVALGIGFIYARQLWGMFPAVLGFLLIAFDPFHVAHSRLLHLDGLLSSLIFLSLLSFLFFLDQNHKRDLIVSGLAAGFSWLTKSPGIILVPIFFLLGIHGMVFSSRTETRLSDLQKSKWQRYLEHFLFPLVLWGGIGLLVFTVFWPAMWVDPLRTLSSVFYEAYQQSSGGWGGPIFFNNSVIPGGNLGNLFYPLAYLWRSTPIVLIGLILALIAIARKRQLPKKDKIQPALVGLLLFVSIFFVFISLGGKKADRYLLPVFPPLDLIAAFGWVAAVNWLAKIRFFNHHKAEMFILSTAVAVQIFLAVRTYPYYLSYYNPILGGGSKAPQVMMVGWGEGLDQAARYLNEKPDAHKKRVISWYGDGSFSYFFQGKTDTFSTTKDLSDSALDRILDLDYAVIYIQQRQRQIPQRLLDILDRETPEYSVWINDIAYVQIYNLADIRK